MRFKKGSKVEVLSRIDVPSGSWRRAEIVSGNGHNYTVRYDAYAAVEGKMVLERVSRKVIRPCPPSTGFLANWVPGDVVEVFDNFSWKMATISKILCEDLLVRLLGSSLEFQVSKFNVRARQSWEDDKWLVIGKGSGSNGGQKHDENLILRFHLKSKNDGQTINTRINIDGEDDCFPGMEKQKFQDSNMASCKILKRGFHGYSQAEPYSCAPQKFRAIEKEGRLYRLVVTNQSPLPEQVNAVALPREMLGKKFFHSAFNNQTQFLEMDAPRRKPPGAVGCSSAIDLEYNDVDSFTSSVGSCSTISNDFYKLHRHAGYIRDTDSNCSDAESVCQWRYEDGNSLFEDGNSLFPTGEELADEIHRLELHAYHCTMEALYASGPLSWEQEELVTNLRMSLHISNDEHLMEGQSGIGLYTSLPNVER